jgi:hypothetical protein
VRDGKNSSAPAHNTPLFRARFYQRAECAFPDNFFGIKLPNLKKKFEDLRGKMFVFYQFFKLVERSVAIILDILGNLDHFRHSYIMLIILV